MDLAGFTSLRATVDVVLRELLCQRRGKSLGLITPSLPTPLLFSRSTRGPDVAALTASMVVWQLPLFFAPKTSSQQCLMLGS